MPVSSSYMTGNPIEMPYQYMPRDEERGTRPNNKRSQSQSHSQSNPNLNADSPGNFAWQQVDDIFTYPLFDELDFNGDNILHTPNLFLDAMSQTIPDPPAPLPLSTSMDPFQSSTEQNTPSTSVSLVSGEGPMAQLILDDFPEDMLNGSISKHSPHYRVSPHQRFSNGPLDADEREVAIMPSVEREDAEGQRSNADLKRSRGEQPDSRSACWTSPLCPNHTKQGTPPDPSTCGAACAPFLFGEIPESNEDPILFRDPNELTSQTIPLREATTGKGDGSVKRESGETQSPDNPALATNPDVPVPSTQATSKSKKRVPHNQVERKYRESLNTQLEALKNVVPSLNPSSYSATADPTGFINASRIANGLLPCDAGDIEDLASTNKPSKAVILASATSYIKQVEREKSKLAEENEKLKARIKALQALVKCDDCSLMRYVMDLKIQPGARGPVNG